MRCAGGKYNDIPGDVCKACGPGRYIPEGGMDQDHQSEDNCINCQLGRYSLAEVAAANSTCTACVSGKYKEVSDGLPCVDCEMGKAGPTVGSTSSGNCEECNQRIIEYIEEDVGLANCKTIKCERDEFLGETGCVPCHQLVSVLVIMGSIVVVVIAGMFVEDAAQERQKMMQIKVLSTFFQCSELTTHVNINWPILAYWSLPFRIPFSDATCITPHWWNIRWNFLAFIYVPLIFFALVFEKWRNMPLNSSEEKKLQQLGVFLAMLWYVGERAKRASPSNTRRGHHTAFSKCTLCDRFGVASRSDAIFV